MDQVSAAYKPSVEVTISPQLRALFAQRFDAGATEIQAAEDAPQTEPRQAPRTVKKARREDWRPIVLRRDGCRPAHFSGQLVFEVSRTWTIADDDYHHTFAVYTDTGGALTGALSLEPHREGSLRPVFWCHPIPDVSAFGAWIDQWRRETLTEVMATANPPQTPTSALHASLRGVLHTLTAQSLRMLQSHLERNDQCHQ